MEEKIMTKRSKGRNWWWLLVILALAGLGYYLYPHMEPELKKVLRPKKVTPVQPERLPPKETSTAKVEEKKPETFAVPKKEEPLERQPERQSEQQPVQPPWKLPWQRPEQQPVQQPWQRPEQQPVQQPVQQPEKVAPKPIPEEDICTKIEEEMKEFFLYLDQKKYVRQLDPARDSYARFKDMLKRCSERPPVPAGEGTDPEILIRNLYHFFRVLGREDLKLIRRVLANERDSMEYILAMLYKWITLDDRCPDPENLRPSLSVRYQYAGFFLNTIGGRAYLYRRTQGLRLLASFYCLLIVHDADKNGENLYGLDVVPYIAPLKEEIGRFSEFDFKREYLEELNRIEDFYNKRR
jgi:hypothetical protein